MPAIDASRNGRRAVPNLDIPAYKAGARALGAKQKGGGSCVCDVKRKVRAMLWRNKKHKIWLSKIYSWKTWHVWTEQGTLAEDVLMWKDGIKGCWKILPTVPPDIVSPIAFRLWFYKMSHVWLLSLFSFCSAQKQEGVDKDVVVWKHSVV